MSNSPNSCKSCALKGNVCELSLAKDNYPLDSRCLECAQAGTDCGIPTDDKKLLDSGIETVSPNSHPGQRKCLNCAMGGKNCMFLQGYRPYPCVSCLRAGATACMIPSSPPPPQPQPQPDTMPVEATTDSYTNMLPFNSLPFPGMGFVTPEDPFWISQSTESQSLLGSALPEHGPAEHVPPFMDQPPISSQEDHEGIELPPNDHSDRFPPDMYREIDLEQKAYVPAAGGTSMKDRLANMLSPRRHRQHKHSPEPESWTDYIDMELERRFS
ncbi:hypothetical protein Hte_003673 [Hypoxylon texense]